MKLTHYDAWAFARLLSGHDLDAAQLARVSKDWSRLAVQLHEKDASNRDTIWQVMLCLCEEDRDAIIFAVAEAVSDGEPPESEAHRRPANLGDIRRLMSQEQWLWEGWLPRSRIAGISAAEGIGKTRLAMDLARRIWFGLEWPDGQAATLPEGTPTLWICSDGQQDDLAIYAALLGMPDDAIHFNTLPEDPYGGTAIDDGESLEMLEEFASLTRYGLVFIDSLTFATSKDLCVANHVKDLMTPVRDIAQKHQTTIVPLLHVSRDGHALGKRIKGLARTILQLECPDPEAPTRLKLSVVKSYAKRPPALGVTLTDHGNEYDSNPPVPPQPMAPGRPPAARSEAETFILDAVNKEGEVFLAELCSRWEEKGNPTSTFWRARKSLEAAGSIVSSPKPVKLSRPNSASAEFEPDYDSF